jgi:glycosyltransferase involved in cell wall biosynthesis
MRLSVLSVAFPFAPVTPRTAGGAEQILATLDRSLIAAGDFSLVLAPEGSQVSGLLIPAPRVPSEITPDAQRRIRHEFRDLLARAIREYAVDVVHLHGLDFPEYLPPKGVPRVVTLHLPLPWYPQQIFRLDGERTALVCVSHCQAESWPGDHDRSVRCRVIENGVDLDQFRPAHAKGKYVVWVGRICPEKAPHLALEAAEKAGAPLYLAGAAFGYESHVRYFQERLSPGVVPPNKFLGLVGGRRKRELLAGARCLLLSSLAPETSSLVAMESLACGTPVIAFRSGALNRLIENGVTGFLVDSVDEMAHAIDKVHELDPVVCRKRAERSFSADRMAQLYFDLYRSLVSGGAPRFANEVLCPAA